MVLKWDRFMVSFAWTEALCYFRAQLIIITYKEGKHMQNLIYVILPTYTYDDADQTHPYALFMTSGNGMMQWLTVLIMLGVVCGEYLNKIY